ncbi:hypothetical protein QR680_016618 [Steinernema hermaphroditum]|uniref:RING-type domain-containing protein n=1 Tax=Steinernema hermaphroditum TaxID=289476 RepID=A0AA39HDQ7_9BILA|nr:hypothetical protein QR680_016618 [Steinernema hermaphroditum]
MTDGAEEILHCRICDGRLPLAKMVQIWPCLHVFCDDCVTAFRGCSKSQFCPELGCHSVSRIHPDTKWNACANEDCFHKLSYTGDIFKVSSCQHELCAQCYDKAVGIEKPVCPVRGCGQLLGEDSDKEICDGPCKKVIDRDRLTATICCGAQLCRPCFESYFPDPDKDMSCPNGRCVDKHYGELKVLRHKATKNGNSACATVVESFKYPILSKCNGLSDCERDALRNFPSESECEHEVCIVCLDKMIGECVVADSLPMCPNEQCHLPYRFESVNALRALLPERKKYFDDLSLEMNNGYENIKDDQVTHLRNIPCAAKGEKAAIVKGSVSEDDDGPFNIKFVRRGVLGEFVRELRRALKITHTEKVYGYFVRRDDCDDEQLMVNKDTRFKPFKDLKIDDTMVIIDVTGIVQARHNGRTTEYLNQRKELEKENADNPRGRRRGVTSNSTPSTGSKEGSAKGSGEKSSAAKK